MALSLLIEHVLDATKAYVLAGLAAQLTLVDADAVAAGKASITITAPASGQIYIGTTQYDTTQPLPGHLLLLLDVIRTEWIDRTSDRRRYFLMLGAMLDNDSGQEETLTRMLSRLGAALVRLFEVDGTLDGAGGIYATRVTAVDWGGVSSGRNALFGSFELSLEMDVSEASA